MLPSGFLRDTFTLKELVTVHTTGRLTQTVSTVSTTMRGYFQPIGGGLLGSPVGRAKEYSMKLFTNYSDEILVNRIVEYNSQEYAIVAVQQFNQPGISHHLEVYLEERRTDIG